MDDGVDDPEPPADLTTSNLAIRVKETKRFGQ